jgi:predicted transcriptional regulator
MEPERMGIPSPAATPTERELQALKIIWQLGRATVREVCDTLEERGQKLAYTTVLSLLQVMEQKGLVGHTARGKIYSYYPKVQRESTFRSLAKGFLEDVFDGAMDEYLVHALQSRRHSAAELDRLAALVEEARERMQGKSPAGEKP